MSLVRKDVLHSVFWLVKGFVVFLLLFMAFMWIVNVQIIYQYNIPTCQKILPEPPFNDTLIRPPRQRPVECGLINASDIMNTSRTIPKFYPCNGTGQTVDISGQFKFDVFNTFCQTSGESLRAILPVYSAPDYYEKRRAIRETVGNECRHFRCKVFFIIGVSLNPNVNEAVQQEYSNNKDILVIDKVDTYRDLNNKAVAMLDWLITYCPQPKYVIHFIDDTYPNINAFLKQLEMIPNNKYILGELNRAGRPFRASKSKWYVSEKEYPYPRYPAYAFGKAYAFLNSDCKLLREKVHATDYNWVEDVWFTGHVANAANFTLKSLKKRCPDVPKVNEADWKKYMCVHRVSPKQYYDIFATIDQTFVLKSIDNFQRSIHAHCFEMNGNVHVTRFQQMFYQLGCIKLP